VLDPESDKPIEINQRHCSPLLPTCLALCLGRESAGGDVDANILVSKYSHERTNATHGNLRIDLPLHLHLDTRSFCAESLIRARWSGPEDKPVTRDQVLRAIEEFKHEAYERDWLDYKSQHWVFLHDGQPYPPKRVLSIATGFPVRSFNAAQARPVLDALGFEVIRKSEYLGRPPALPTTPAAS
jgi:hypothetical protein